MAALNFSFPTSFTDLLASDDYPINTGATTGTTVTKGLGDRIAERTGSVLPKFKSFPPPSLPVSPPPVSPSSYFAFPPGLSPTMLLDSPVLLYGSNILPSPTTGTGSIFAEAFNWKNDSGNFNQVVKEEDKYQSNFSLDSRPLISESQATKIPLEQKNHYWNMQDSINQDGLFTENNTAKSDYTYQQTFSPEIANLANNSQPNSRIQPSNNHYKQSSQTVSEKKRSEDGYNWRKYGQKQVRGSENPRSYYKCTYPNCPTRKKLERSIEGHITEIVYTGNHNHPKPQATKRSSSSSNSSVVLHPYNVQANDTIQDSATTPDNSSVSLGDGDFVQSPEKSLSIGEEFDNEEPQAKRWKRESQNECISAMASKTVREARVVVQTTSDIDILDDGYRWRKYGQKAVKGNPNPRSYYKCTCPGCPVRKHVERASEDLRSVMTTYEGKHNHDVPAARGSGNSHSLIKPVPSNLNENRATGNQVPYTLQMLQSPEMFGFTTL